MSIQFVTFPNCLCLFMMLAVLFHMFTRDATTREVREIQVSLEVVFCKFPQTWKKYDSTRCSSVRNLFLLLANGCSFQKPSRVVDLLLDSKNDYTREEGEDGDENFKSQIVFKESAYDSNIEMEGAERINEKEVDKKGEEETSSLLVDSFVICLLVFSAIVSLMEWYKEKKKRNVEQVRGGGQPPGEVDNLNIASAANRRFSLADLTVNRHIRRKDSQQQHQQQIVRQASTGAAVKPGCKSAPPLLRRSSFPAQFPEVRSRQSPPQRQQSQPGVPPSRRLSVDLADDDSSPDRRRVRIIRRH